MSETVYIETSIVGYLTARSTKNLILAANIEVTKEWWESRRNAVHIAAATVHGIDYPLTWNCKHIANAQIQRKLEEISFDFGYQLPVICTPYELLGD